MTAPGAGAPEQPSAHQLADVHALVLDASSRIAAWPERAAFALAPALAKAQAELQQSLTAWLTSIPDGAQRFTAQKYASTLLQLEGALDGLRHLAPAVHETLTAYYTPMGRDALAQMTREYARMLDVFGGVRSAPKLDLDTAAIVADRENLLLPRFQSSAARYGDTVIADIQGELVKGILLNETYSEMIARLVRIRGPVGEVAIRGRLGDPDAVTEQIGEGLFQRYRWWAHRIVRTELQHAANLTLDDGIRRLAQVTPGLVRRWDACIDRRICAECWALNGTTAPIGGVFPGGIDTAPAHPCCRCRVGAWRPEWAPYLELMREIQ
jgi:hypothetical protein